MVLLALSILDCRVLDMKVLSSSSVMPYHKSERESIAGIALTREIQL